MSSKPTVVLERFQNPINLNEIATKGSILQINQDYDEIHDSFVDSKVPSTSIDFIGQPVKSFALLERSLVAIDENGFVKKKILDEGGGLPLDKGCTVHLAVSGYMEKELEPFEVYSVSKPLIVDLNDSGLLPGLQMATESMLVGEVSVFLLSYKVMYGPLGMPPKIKPEADCVFYIKLIKSTLTPKEGKLDSSEPNTFLRLYLEVKKMYASGYTLYKCKNYSAAIQLFRKAVFMLHRARLADEIEENKQENMLKKLYVNLAICYNATKQPLKACVSCNELNRLNNLWNNEKALFQNAKSLRMIGEFEQAEHKLKRALKLSDGKSKSELESELELIRKLRDSCNQSKIVMKNINAAQVSEEFKQEVENLIKNFKEQDGLCKLTLPGTLNTAELEFVKETCIKADLFFNRVKKEYALDKEDVTNDGNEESEDTLPESSVDSNDQIPGSNLSSRFSSIVNL